MQHKIAYLVFAVTKKPDNHKEQCISVEKTGMKEEIGDDWRESFIDAVKESGTVSVSVSRAFISSERALLWR